MKLALIADVHLDAQFGQFPADVARRRRQAIRDTLSAAVARAISDGAEALLVAGDLYEHDRISVSPDTRNFLRDQFAELHPVPVFIAPGNHDWLGPAEPLPSCQVVAQRDRLHR